MPKKIVYFKGPRSMQQRLQFKFQNKAVIRHFESIQGLFLLNKNRKLFNKNLVIIKPQFLDEFKQSIPNCLLLIDRVDDSKHIIYRHYAIGNPSTMGDLASKSIVLNTIDELPADIFLQGHILTQIFLPYKLRSEATKLQNKPNIICFIYQELQVKTYIIGNMMQSSALAKQLRGTILNKPKDLSKNKDILQSVPIIIYCKKEDQEEVIENMSGYKGHKKIIVSKNFDSKLQELNNIHHTFVTDMLGYKNKLIFISQQQNDPFQDYYRTKYCNYPYLKLKFISELQNVTDLHNKQTNIVIVAYEDKKKLLQRELQNKLNIPKKEFIQLKKRMILTYASCQLNIQKKQSIQSEFKNAQFKNQKLLVFLSDKMHDPQEKELKRQNHFDYYKKIYKPENIKQVRNIMRSDIDVLLIGYESSQSILRKIIKNYLALKGRYVHLKIIYEQIKSGIIQPVRIPQSFKDIQNDFHIIKRSQDNINLKYKSLRQLSTGMRYASTKNINNISFKKTVEIKNTPFIEKMRSRKVINKQLIFDQQQDLIDQNTEHEKVYLPQLKLKHK